MGIVCVCVCEREREEREREREKRGANESLLVHWTNNSKKQYDFFFVY